MMMMRAALIGLCVLPTLALARQPAALHDKSWYVANPATREITLAWCHADASRSHLFDCQNAEAAATALLFSGTNRDPLSFMDRPEYWAQNPIARQGELRVCASGAPSTGPYLRYCSVAAQAESWSRH